MQSLNQITPIIPPKNHIRRSWSYIFEIEIQEGTEGARGKDKYCFSITMTTPCDCKQKGILNILVYYGVVIFFLMV